MSAARPESRTAFIKARTRTLPIFDVGAITCGLGVPGPTAARPPASCLHNFRGWLTILENSTELHGIRASSKHLILCFFAMTVSKAGFVRSSQPSCLGHPRLVADRSSLWRAQTKVHCLIKHPKVSTLLPKVWRSMSCPVTHLEATCHAV